MDLEPEEVRVLGCLVEKQTTTPDQYPLTTNALVTACNQKSNRDPVVGYDDRQVDATVLSLRERGLARTVKSGRAWKHKHVLDEAWGLPDGELAVLAVLMLRGPQTVGELRTRTERMHPFETLGDVEAALGALAGHNDPFVVQLDRQPGQKESRWAHLLHGEPVIPVAPTLPQPAPPTRQPAASAEEVAELREQVAELRRRLDHLYELLGE